jgi:co-chaperonin GroES (HSP10)
VPLLDRVLVQRIKAETKTACGIFLPESSLEKLNEAKVLAVGPGGLDKDGKRIAMGVAEGDRVLIPQVCWHGTMMMIKWISTDWCSSVEVLSRLEKKSIHSTGILSKLRI